MSKLERCLCDQSGATAIEYGLSVVGIAVAIIAIVNSMGGESPNTYSEVSDNFANAGQ
jgi:Flp pilus assembly pilin Flp